MKKDDTLFFYATLEKQNDWSPCIIGYFKNIDMHDCRELSKEEILRLKNSGFENNAHLKRIDPDVDFLVKGGEGSQLLKKAFALAEDSDHSSLRRPLIDIVLTPTGKKVRPRTPWFRWTLTCSNCSLLFEMIDSIQLAD